MDSIRIRKKMWTGINQYSTFMCLQFKNEYSAWYELQKGWIYIDTTQRFTTFDGTFVNKYL